MKSLFEEPDMRNACLSRPTRQNRSSMMMESLEGRELCSMAMLGPAHLVGPSPSVEVSHVSVPLNPDYKLPALVTGDALRKCVGQASPVLPLAPVAHINAIHYVGASSHAALPTAA